MQTLINIWFRSDLKKCVCLVCLGLSFWHAGFSQNNPDNFKESIFLRTDRDLYVVGEQVWLKAYKLDARENRPENLSKMVYFELLNQSGYPVNQVKVHVPDKSGTAGFRLSDTLSSGNYLLRAYSNWMKNSPDSDFSFRTISVINPFRSVEKIGIKQAIPEAGSFDIQIRQRRTGKGLLLEAEFDTTDIGTRERVKVHIRARDSLGNPVKTDLSVSIVRSCLIHDHGGEFLDPFDASREELPAAPPRYLPELDGVVLSGTVWTGNTKEPMKHKSIMLSIVGNAAKCQVYRTNHMGKFYFNLNDPGVLEIVIQPVDSSVSNYYVELEPDFHNAYDHPMPGPLILDTTKLRELNRVITNMQIENIYKHYRYHDTAGTPDTPDLDFYGEPEYHIQISDYIRLKSVREVIKEIVPEVSVRMKGGKTTLRVYNGVDNIHFDNKPLVLVDGVLFDDVDQILNIPLQEMERIEVINLRYFLDGHVFEGIVHFITESGKMAGLEFGQAVFRQAYTTFSGGFIFKSPEYGIDSLKNSSLPDFRNTLYWNPGIQTREDGNTGFEFYTSDDPGEYAVFLEGFSSDGEYACIVKKLLVQ